MDVVYKNWKSGEKFEEAQAKIYTEVSGLPANAEEIGPRNDLRGTDATRYAFTKDGEPLAYITSYVSDEESGRMGIGFPWGFKNCPVEVQEKLLFDMIDTWKKKEGTHIIETNVDFRSKIKDEQISFFEERGFVQEDTYYRFTKDFEVDSTSKKKFDGKAGSLKAMVATEDDLETLIELTKSDPRMRTAFPNDDAYVPYFKDRVLKDGHAVILYDGDTAVAASAPLLFKPDGGLLQGNEERVIMRFTSIRPGYSYAWERLLSETAKGAKEAGWDKTPIRVMLGFRTQDALAVGVSAAVPELEHTGISYVYRGAKKEE